MKTLLVTIIVLVVLHLIAAAGFVGWLGASDRVSMERVRLVVDAFTPTLTEQARARAEAAAAEAEAAAARDRLMRLDRVAQGPETIEQRLMKNFEADEMDLHRLERLQAETEAIRRRLDQDKALIAEQLAALEAERAAFEAAVAERAGQMEDEDFRRAVRTLEQLPAKQAKAMIQQYLAADQVSEAVDYLAAMQLRKSAGVLKAFKDGPEIAQATLLLEELRTRGVDLPGAEAGDTLAQDPAS